MNQLFDSFLDIVRLKVQLGLTFRNAKKRSVRMVELDVRDKSDRRYSLMSDYQTIFSSPYLDSSRNPSLQAIPGAKGVLVSIAGSQIFQTVVIVFLVLYAVRYYKRFRGD